MSKEAVFWYSILLGYLFFMVAITWIAFARLTMARIERDMKRDNLATGFAWDGVGSRIFFYAYAIVFSENIATRFNRLINVALVRSYANQGDWLRGVLFLVATTTWFVVGLVGVVLDPYHY